MTQPALNRHHRRRQRSQQQLEQATLELLIEQGYDGFSIQEIADRADLGRGTFYLHFRDKEEAVWAVFIRGLREVEARSLLRQGEPFTAPGIAVRCLSLFEQAQTQPELFSAMFGRRGSAALSARAADWLASFFSGVSTPESSTDEHSGKDVSLKLQSFTGGVVRVLAIWLEDPNRPTPEQIVHELAREIAGY